MPWNPIQVIELEDHDDVNTIRDRLLTAQSPRVLLVIPWDSPALRKPVDLQVVQRSGEANGIEVAIVSTEGEIRTAAHEVGLPAFRSVDAAQRKARWHKTHDEEDELKPWTPSKRKRREAERAAVERNQAVAQVSAAASGVDRLEDRHLCAGAAGRGVCRAGHHPQRADHARAAVDQDHGGDQRDRRSRRRKKSIH